MKLKQALATVVPVALLATTAHAFRQPDYLDERPLETAEGAPGRGVRTPSWKTPAAAAKAWRDFGAAHGTRWTALWDADLATPTRIYGDGIAAPRSIEDAEVAAAAARALLSEQLALLAPGSKAEDFVLSVNARHAGGTMRVVSFEQTWGGLQVIGGHVSFLFKNDRLFVISSTASPGVAPAVPTSLVDTRVAETAAVDWITAVYGAAPVLLGTADRVVLPIARERDDGQPVLEHRVVVPVDVDLTSPRAQWTVYVDAETGKPVARTQRLMFASGTIRYRVSARHPGAGYQEYPAPFARHQVDGSPSMSTISGQIEWASSVAASVTPSLVGSYASVSNAAGPRATATLTVDPDGSALWDLATDEFGDAQLSTFIHANLAKQYAIANLDSTLSWLGEAIPVVANEDDICNAYSNLDDIHFFRAGSEGNFTCQNTGRLADVVYHEFGHSLHGQAQLGAEFDGSMSEGVSDYFAATVTNDPAMGIGFFGAGALRHLDPDNREFVWPDDVVPGRVHDTGRIIAGTLWDLRKALVLELGAGPGVELADDIFYGIIQRADDIPSSYVEALAVDDDDGNLANGTPHQCTINAAFGMHGLIPTDLAPPVRDDLTLTLEQLADTGGTCPGPKVASAIVKWHLRGDAAVSGEVPFSDDGATLAATLPSQADGEVVQYQVEVTLDTGTLRTFPDNPSDTWYELYVGPVTEIYCTDFEDDPVVAGWTFTGDFQWGTPTAIDGRTDPQGAFSGDFAIGMDLGAEDDSDYERDANSTAVSPEIDVSGYADVRLQYRRWLNVEDALYDQATISVDGQTAWGNGMTEEGERHHLDSEWRFHDVPVGNVADDGKIQVSFGLIADQGLQFGGWTVDQLCVVATGAGQACGNGVDNGIEECDDGNLADGDGCSSECVAEPGLGGDGGCCSSGDRDGVAGPLLLGLGTLVFAARRRRRRVA